MTKAPIFVVLTLMLSATVSMAFSPNIEVCTYYSAKSESSPADIVSLVSRLESGSAVKICSSRGGSVQFHLVSQIYRKDGVSFFNSTQIFRIKNIEKEHWTYHSPFSNAS